MHAYSYYPFKNRLEEVEAKDLADLKSISEGWYVEYKVQPIKIVEFAKHLSAFANQHGGWLFIGIKETSDGSRCAESFPGIDTANINNLSIQIREASSAHINPPVLYEEKIINGPCEDIGLSENKSILIVGIPKSVNTPHIHSSGRIFRRLADHSDPKPETDRHILDDLWKRGEVHRLQVTKFLSETPPLPQTASNNPWIYIYFRPDENQPRPIKSITFEIFTDIVTNTSKIVRGPHAPMDTVYNAPNGFIARQTKGNDPSLPNLTFHWWHDGTARLEIPLNKYDLESLRKIGTYHHAQDFCSLLRRINFEKATVVDYSSLLMAVSALSNIYLELLKILEDTRGVYSCCTLKNISYTSPYLDTAHYLSRIEKYSLPLNAENEIRLPSEPNQGNMYIHTYKSRFDLTENADSAISIPMRFSAPLFGNILLSVGAIHNDTDWTEDMEMYGLGIKPMPTGK
jgi:hypothetical protein